MPRGRPRKVVVEEEEKDLTIKDIIADAAHKFCSIPGCLPRLHKLEAEQVIASLDLHGYTIVESQEKD